MMNPQQPQEQDQQVISMDFHQVRDDDGDFPSPPQTPLPYNRSGHSNYVSDSESILELDRIRRVRQEEERSSYDYFLHFDVSSSSCDVSQAASIPAATSNKHQLVDDDSSSTSRKRQCYGLCIPPTSPLLLPVISSSAPSSSKSTPTTNRTTRAVSMDEDHIAQMQQRYTASIDSSSESDDSSIVNIMTPVRRAVAVPPKSPEFGLRPRRSLHLHAIIDIDSLAISNVDHDNTTPLCRNNCSTNKSYKYFSEYDDTEDVVDTDTAMIASLSRDANLPYMPLY